MPSFESPPSSPNPSECPTEHNLVLGTSRRNGKRLIILCDGTWQDAESSPEKRNPPTNIIRLARAIKPTTWIKEEVDEYDEHNHKREGHKKTVERQIDQIVYYQSGVGTGIGDRLTGGSFGLGLSEKVRGAYSFIANNYVAGDRIFIFGFSRGAFTARAIAGLVSKMGLLDKRGMDNFPEVYKKYWKMPRDLTDVQEELQWKDARREFGLEDPEPGLIEAMGVFDTVGFHRPLTGRFAWLDRFLGEQNELRNTELPATVRHAFQALSLDENRFAFRPTLWYLPKKLVNGVKRDTVLKQVWFSGEHSDCGGGKKDPRLSNISLGWMISEFVERNLLEFDPEYLLDDDNLDHQFRKTQRWAPSQGEGGKWWEGQNVIVRVFLALLYTFILDPYINFSEWLGRTRVLGLRSPGMYHKAGFRTNEFIHASVQDRKLERVPFPIAKNNWPSKALRDWVAPQDQIKSQPAVNNLEKLLTNTDENLGDYDNYGIDDYANFDALGTTKSRRNDPRNSKEKEQDRRHETKFWKKTVNGEVFSLRQTVVSDVELRCKNNIRSADPAHGSVNFSRSYGRKVFETKFHKFGQTVDEAKEEDWQEEQDAIKADECPLSSKYKQKHALHSRREERREQHEQQTVKMELVHKQKLEALHKRESDHLNQLGLEFKKNKKGSKHENQIEYTINGQHGALTT